MSDLEEYQKKRAEEVKSLGSGSTEYEFDYNPKLLEAFENVNSKDDYWVNLYQYEFVSQCPKTGQPDFATIVINYIPAKKMVESKALKLYLFSFRNSGEFHEDVINKIKNDLVKLMKPKYLEVIGYFYPRGNIAIHPAAYYNNGKKKYRKLEEKRFSLRYIEPRIEV